MVCCDDKEPHDKGFSLVELLVTLFIASAVLLLIAPVIGRIGGSATLSDDGRRIISALRDTKTAALRRGQSEVLLVDIANNLIRFNGRKSISGAILAPIQLSPSLGLTIRVSEEHRLSDTLVRFVFYPDGRSSGGHFRLQRKTSDQSSELEINVYWLTGAIEMLSQQEDGK